MSRVKSTEALRAAAEARLTPSAEVPAQSYEALLHELQVHQIELEMQNENLRLSHIELEASRDRYVNSYEMAPVGFVTLNRDGVIIAANLTCAALLQEDRAKLLKHRFDTCVVRQDVERWHRHLVDIWQGQQTSSCEVRLTRRDGSTVPVLLSLVGVPEEASPVVHIALTDITEYERLTKENLEASIRYKDVLTDAIAAIAATLEQRDPYTAGHQRRVAELAVAIGREMGLDDDKVEGLYFGGLIHDIGKIAVPTEILGKPGRLNDIEFGLIKTHSEAGFEIIKDIDFPWPVAEMVLQHHERMDGSGYPLGLKGEQILLEARILAVADVVEAMSVNRPYRAGLGMQAALDEITRERGNLLDALAVDACLRIIREMGFAFSK